VQRVFPAIGDPGIDTGFTARPRSNFAGPLGVIEIQCCEALAWGLLEILDRTLMPGL